MANIGFDCVGFVGATKLTSSGMQIKITYANLCWTYLLRVRN